jgi:hypothetical protein
VVNASTRWLFHRSRSTMQCIERVFNMSSLLKGWAAYAYHRGLKKTREV